MSAPFDPPAGFLAALQSEHHGRLRIRWSDSQCQWHIEQRVGARRPPRGRLDHLNDRAVRWQDGFEFLLAVTPGTTTRCPKCSLEVKVPVMSMTYAKCGWCGKEFRACYWPLGDMLLEWLRYGDPYRGGLERMFTEADESAHKREFWETRARKGARKDAIWDDWRQLMGIEQVGYTGKVFQEGQ